MERVRLKRRLEAELQHLPKGRLKRQELLNTLAEQGIITRMPPTRFVDDRGRPLPRDRSGDCQGWVKIPGEGQYCLGGDVLAGPDEEEAGSVSTPGIDW